MISASPGETSHHDITLVSRPFRFGDDIPGMEGLGTDITVVCPWEAYGDLELGDLAKYGIV